MSQRIASSVQRIVRHPSPITHHPSSEVATRYLVGGVNSPVRAFRQVGGEPLLLASGKGSQVVSDRGERFIDFIMGWGALILGHNHPQVIKALKAALANGTLMGLTHPAEVELARLIVEAVPSVEQIRFTASGTEACLTAVKLARAHTGRTKILAFDGCYHGHGESLMARKSAGIPEALAAETLTIPFNDVAALARTMDHHAHELAAVILEPVAANMGVVLPEPGYLAQVRELTRQRGIVLIFDEVVTGFRVGLGGAQGLFGIHPDLTTFGKIIGGGLPIGALGGSRELMQHLAPEGEVYHGGTFAGHPLSMQAGCATLKLLAAQPPYESLEELTGRLVERLHQSAREARVPVQINHLGSMLTLFFSSEPVRNFTGAKAGDRARFASWAMALRAQGILIPPSPYEALFLSTAHTSTHIDRVIDASRRAWKSR